MALRTNSVRHSKPLFGWAEQTNIYHTSEVGVELEWIQQTETDCSTFRPEEDGDDFVKRWASVYNEYQWDTPHIAQATLHTMLGQLPSVRAMRIYTSKARYEDGRVHTIWMQPSGTGKQGGFDFVSDVSSNIILPHEEFKYETKNKFTSAALLGGPSNKRIQKWNKSTKENETQSIIKPGILEPGQVNLFACQEIGPLFDSKSEHSEESMTWLQIAMDPIGRNQLTKDIQSMEKPITIYPECSIFFASYIPTNFSKETVQRGFVQRVILIINPVPIGERKANMKRAVRGFGTPLNEVEELKQDTRYLGQYLSYINNKYKDVEMTVDIGVTDNLLGVVDQVYSLVEDLPAYQQEELQKFTTRAIAQVCKITWHHCILRGDTVVNSGDVVYAEAFLNPIWRQMVSFYEDALESANKVAEAERTWNYELSVIIGDVLTDPKKSKNGWVLEQEVIDKLKTRMRKTKGTIRNKINASVDSGMIRRGVVEYKGKKTPVIRMAKEVTLK